MKIEITYPPLGKKTVLRNHLRKLFGWPVAIAFIACPVVNLIIGGAAWSAVTDFGLYMLWSLLLSPDLVEYNRISQVSKLVVMVSIQLVLIDVLLSSGWAIKVVPIVVFSGLTLIGILFFTDLSRQRQNVMPMLWTAVLFIIAWIIAVAVWKGSTNWPTFVAGAAAFTLITACCSALRKDMLRELKKRFHIK